MKVRSLLVSMLCMLALSVSFASCSDDDDLLDDSGSTVALPQVRAFFLNAGSQGANNSNIAFISGSIIISLFIFYLHTLNNNALYLTARFRLLLRISINPNIYYNTFVES